MSRPITSIFLSIALILTSLAGVVAQTRMAAAGSFCGPGQTAIVLDAAGIPVLDADGRPIAAPDCLSCHMPFAMSATPAAQIAQTHPYAPAPQTPFINHFTSMVRQDGQPRAPPALA